MSLHLILLPILYMFCKLPAVHQSCLKMSMFAYKQKKIEQELLKNSEIYKVMKEMSLIFSYLFYSHVAIFFNKRKMPRITYAFTGRGKINFSLTDSEVWWKDFFLHDISNSDSSHAGAGWLVGHFIWGSNSIWELPSWMEKPTKDSGSQKKRNGEI